MIDEGKDACCPKEDPGRQGGSLMYVILLVTFLAVLSNGYMVISQYNMKAALNSRSYMEAQTAAKTIHRSFCESVSRGDSEAMNLLWRCFEEDCNRVQEEFDAMMERKEENGGDGEENGGDGEEDSGDGEETGGDGEETGDGRDGGKAGEEAAGADASGEDSWERYLRRSLGHKKYVIRGTAPHGEDGLEVDITLTAVPLMASACVHTRVRCNGYQFSMMADIVFDDRDGAVMTIGHPDRSVSRGLDEIKIYLNGNGVYRYYEDEAD